MVEATFAQGLVDFVQCDVMRNEQVMVDFDVTENEQVVLAWGFES
jgi:hypothetical protein